MKNTLIALGDRLRNNYWFIPALMAVGAFMLSFVTVAVDSQFGGVTGVLPQWDAVSNAEGARTVLATIAGSMITVAGTTFSLLLVVLSLASQQYGPLVVGNFIRDWGNQFVLGMFTATFLYCMRVMTVIRSENEGRFVPQFATLVGVGLAVFSLAVLIYFIHHISESIRSYTIIGKIRHNLQMTIEEMYPEGRDAGNSEFSAAMPPADYTERSAPILARDGGYLQLVDEEALLALAEEQDVVLELPHRQGAFILKGSLIGRLYPAEKQGTTLSEQFNEALYVGDQRTPAQDVELMITQMASIAVRALSPAINDPYTAGICIDRLGEALSDMARRKLPPYQRCDSEGRLRLITTPITFDEMVHLAFDQIRHYGGEDLVVVTHLLKTLRMIGESLHDTADESALRRYAQIVRDESLSIHKSDYARQMIELAFASAIMALAD